VQALKGRAPMYSDEERLFMVRQIKGVHNAALSVGSGRFDFVEDAKELRPDIYFVNDDASQLEERMSLFEKARFSRARSET
jgi:glycerol-3-phosphate cytidylyltransferase-like family protein